MKPLLCTLKHVCEGSLSADTLRINYNGTKRETREILFAGKVISIRTQDKGILIVEDNGFKCRLMVSELILKKLGNKNNNFHWCCQFSASLRVIKLCQSFESGEDLLVLMK